MIELQTTWGWQVALYLFLGGLGAGIFIAATLLGIVRRKRHRWAIEISYWISVACIALGLLSLLAEVVHPGRALLMWQSFSHLTSWMTWGAWSALAALIMFFVTAFLTTKTTSQLLASVWESSPGLRGKLRRACSIIGLAPALVVVFYTGMLLRAAQGVPFWNSYLLPCLFVASALGAGINSVTALAVLTKSTKKVSRRRRWLIAGLVIGAATVESVLLFMYTTNMIQGGSGSLPAQQLAATASVKLLVFGAYALPFWGLVVVGGIAVPLFSSILSLFVKNRVGWKILVAGALFTVLGDCALRFLCLYAGTSADYVGSALLSIL